MTSIFTSPVPTPVPYAREPIATVEQSDEAPTGFTPRAPTPTDQTTEPTAQTPAPAPVPVFAMDQTQAEDPGKSATERAVIGYQTGIVTTSEPETAQLMTTA